MRLPKKVKILGKTYTVEYCDVRKDKESSSAIKGYICPTEQIIRIDNHNCTRQTQESTLLHEIIHAVSDGVDLDLKEHAVSLLETGLYQVLNDNGFLKEK